MSSSVTSYSSSKSSPSATRPLSIFGSMIFFMLAVVRRCCKKIKNTSRAATDSNSVKYPSLTSSPGFRAGSCQYRAFRKRPSNNIPSAALMNFCVMSSGKTPTLFSFGASGSWGSFPCPRESRAISINKHGSGEVSQTKLLFVQLQRTVGHSNAKISHAGIMKYQPCVAAAFYAARVCVCQSLRLSPELRRF